MRKGLRIHDKESAKANIQYILNMQTHVKHETYNFNDNILPISY